ncbi:MAG: flagellar motor switch protein FliG, partial [Rhodospirillales bacterium]|nr:flagellar motor switch protein FliG [Rhodospirillales bacterium]
MAKSKSELRNLSGQQKAAVFMLALGQEHSAHIFELMDDEEIRDMSQT